MNLHMVCLKAGFSPQGDFKSNLFLQGNLVYKLVAVFWNKVFGVQLV